MGTSRFGPPRAIRLAAAILPLLIVEAAAQVHGTALVRHTPIVNGTVDGSLHVLTAGPLQLSGGAIIRGDLVVPGTPNVRLKGRPTIGETIVGSGDPTPSGWPLTFNGTARVGRLLTRVGAVSLPAVESPPAPAGMRDVIVDGSTGSIGDFGTVRNLTLSGGAGEVTLPPATYGGIVANGDSVLTIGVAGSTQPSLYRMQRLTLKGASELRVVGPVIVTVEYGVSVSGVAVAGTAANPAWLRVESPAGDITLHGGAAFHGVAITPGGHVTLNGHSLLAGGVASNWLAVRGGAVLRPLVLNRPPTAEPQVLAVNEDTAVMVVLGGSDPDGDPISHAIVERPRHGTLAADVGSAMAGRYVYTPDPDYHGSDVFEFSVSDGALASTAAVSVRVLPVNDPPVVEEQSVTVASNRSVTVTLRAIDADGDPLTYSVVGAPEHGTLAGAGAILTYTPAPGTLGPDRFTFKASDGMAESEEAAVNVTVDPPVNDPPVVNAGEYRSIVLRAGLGSFSNVVVNNDEWTLSDFGLEAAPTARNFALNIARQFTGGGDGRFLVYSTNFGLAGARLAQVMTAAGHEWDRSMPILSAELLREYDGVFLCGTPVDAVLLIDYVERGGNVYLAGTGFNESGWNPFLDQFGLKFGAPLSVAGVVPVTTAHPLLDGVQALYYDRGNEVMVTQPENTGLTILHQQSGHRLLALSSRAGGRMALSGSVTDDGLPEPPSTTAVWSKVSGPGRVVFRDGQRPATEAFFSEEGTYVLRLTASDGEEMSFDEVTLAIIENQAPLVNPGPGIVLRAAGKEVVLFGVASDDGRPAPLEIGWSVLDGPGDVTFGGPSAAETVASFSAIGTYVLKLAASDGLDTSEALLEARVGVTAMERPSELAAWWPLNGHTREVVRGAHALTRFADAAHGPGLISQGLLLDGADDLARVGAHDDLDVGTSEAGFTIELWVRPTAARDVPLVMWASGATQGVSLRQWSFGRGLYAMIKDSAGADHIVSAEEVFLLGQWQHVAVTYDRRTGWARLYHDGVLRREQDLGVFRPRTDLDFAVGGSEVEARYFHGTLDEITLYRRPLSNAEIVALHRIGAGGKSPLDGNAAPAVDAGPDLILGSESEPARLQGAAADDGAHLADPLIAWEQVDGPGTVTFLDPSAASTEAHVSAPGTYLLRLTAHDGLLESSDLAEIRVGVMTADLARAAAAWWPLNGHPRESIRGGHDLDLMNGAGYGSGQVSQGVAFDGTNDFVRTPAHADLDVGASTDGLTIELWVKPDRNQDVPLVAWATPTEVGASLRQWSFGSGLYGFLTDTAGHQHVIAAGGVFAPGEWQHVALTYDRPAGRARLYRNGVLLQEQHLGSFTPKTSRDLYAGGLPIEARYFKGALDEITLYRRALTGEEIARVFAAGAGGKAPIRGNQAPVVSAGVDRTAYVGGTITLTGAASDDGLPDPPAALVLAWTKIEGPGEAIFSAPQSAVTDVMFEVAGEYVLRLEATDSEKMGMDDITIAVSEPPSAPPEIRITSPSDGSAVPASMPVRLIARAEDRDGNIHAVEFYRGATKLGGAGAVVGSPGSYGLVTTFDASLATVSLTAVATDDSGASTVSAPVTVAVVPYEGPPTAQLLSPAEDVRITQPLPVTGVVASAVLKSWRLESRLKAAEGQEPEAWKTVASGTANVGTPASETSAAEPGLLGTFDPTLLLNGVHEVRLRATDAAGVTVIDGPITVVVEGSLKLGAFSLTFTDLEVPVLGIPITVARTYDSRDSRPGDFGPGWRLAVASVRVQKTRDLGLAWWQTPQEGDTIQFYYVEPQRERIVTVAMPDGETHRFRAGAYVKNRDGDPDNASFGVVVREGLYKFYPVGDTTATLEPVDAAGQLYDRFWLQGTGEQDLYAGEYGDFDFIPYNPTRFRLTTKEGVVLLLDEVLGLLEMQDLSGNTLFLNRNDEGLVTGITSRRNAPEGAVMRSVSIVRDAEGRVDYIRDPAGRDLDYLYDDQGRLASFSDRELNVTQYRYREPSLPHYLTDIVDPRGVTALRSEYDEKGRLVRQIDADGRETIFARGIDASGRFERVRDRLGNEITVYYDARGNVAAKIDPLGAQTTYTYYPDSDRVKFVVDHYGNARSFAYDARGNVEVETVGAALDSDPRNPSVGHVMRTTYNTYSSPTSITDPDGRLQTFTYDAATNHLLSHTVGAGSGDAATTTYTYHSDGTLASVVDALGTITAHVYDEAVSDPAHPGAIKEITTTVSDASGAALRRTRSLHDSQENLIAQIVTRTLPGGRPEDVVTRYRYDAENRLRATIHPDGRVTETRYTSFGAVEASIEWRSVAEFETGATGAGRVTAHTYDSRGNRVATIYPDGTAEEKGYDLESRCTWIQDARGHRTFFIHDATGRLRFTIHPDADDQSGTGFQPAISDDSGTGILPVDPSDPRLANNPRTETRYDLIGRVIDSFDELGNRTQTVYFSDGTPDAGQRRQTIVALDTGDLVTSYQYDKAGNVRFVTDPRGNTVEIEYDAHARPRRVVYPATDEHPATQTTTTYDLLGRRIAVTDQEGRITRFRHDGLGRPIGVRQYLDSAAAASDADHSLPDTHSSLLSTRYSYDEVGNQTAQTDALGRTTRYEHDRVGRRIRRILPGDGGPDGSSVETLAYDEWGNLWKRTDFAGHTTTFGYDTLGRLRSKAADPAHPSLSHSHTVARIEYDYDETGARRAARTYNRAGVLLYSEGTPRDERGRVVYKDTALGRLGYTYAANGLLQDVVSSNADGVNLGYRYDEANRLVQVDDASQGLPPRTHRYTYNPSGSVESFTTANGISHAYTYDALNRLRTLEVKVDAMGTGGAPPGTLLRSYTYRLRPSGQRREVVDWDARYALPATRSYQYDDRYRLVGETVANDPHGNNGTITYALDQVGNRLSRTSSIPAVPSVVNQTYTARDWLATDTYDRNGNTVQSGTGFQPAGSASDHYDFEDRLIVRLQPDGSTINVSYDADGIRRQKTLLDAAGNLASVTTYLTDTNNLTGYAQVFEERTSDAGGTGAVVYAYGHDLISRAETSTSTSDFRTHYYAYDGHGSVRGLTDENGAVTDWYDYDAFGVLVHREGVTDNVYLYCGEQHDSDLGLYYLRARYLNPDTGRFWSMDPYEGHRGDPASLHKYTYGHANPIGYKDPSGHVSMAEVQIGLVIVGTLNGMAINSARTTLGQASDIFSPAGELNSALVTLDQAMFVYEQLSLAIAAGAGSGIATRGLLNAWKSLAPSLAKAGAVLRKARPADLIRAQLGRILRAGVRGLPGPQVPAHHASNFTRAAYVNRQVSGDEVFFKYHGLNNRTGKTHNYVTTKKYTSEAELRADLAILDEWGIEIDRVTTFRPARGTWISEGTAASQTGRIAGEVRLGGGYQGLIDVQNLPKSSVIRTDLLNW